MIPLHEYGVHSDITSPWFYVSVAVALALYWYIDRRIGKE